MIVADQSAVHAFLASAMAKEGSVEVVETHISHLVLGPARVWKLKRAVRLSYVDFSTTEFRLACCEREVVLNRRTAPDHYLGVRRICRAGEDLAFDGDGPLVDAVVEMRRFDQDALLDRLAMRGALTETVLERVAAEIARFHGDCEPDLRSGSDRVAEVLAVNEAAFAETGIFPASDVEALNRAFRQAAEAHRPLLDARGSAGQVRRAHGDLHLRNIFLEAERPILFDCIEFNDAVATVDILYDLAFLLMDLHHRGLKGAANLVMNRYLDLTGDEAGMPLIPFFMALRAAVRAHVTATTIEEGGDTSALREEARAYFDLARRLLRPARAEFVALGGLSGSGKSTVAAALAPSLPGGAGARTLSTDRLRKALHGVSAETRLPKECYGREITARVYGELEARAGALAAAGVSVVADAVFADPAERERMEDVAREAGAPFRGVWLEAPVALLRDRIRARRGGPSDATLRVLESQFGYDLGSMTWTRLDASRAPADIAATICQALADRVEPAQTPADQALPPQPHAGAEVGRPRASASRRPPSR